MQKRTETKRINVLDKRVFELAKKMPDIMPELFVALEEYDRTHKLVDWRKKVNPKTDDKRKAAANI